MASSDARAGAGGSRRQWEVQAWEAGPWLLLEGALTHAAANALYCAPLLRDVFFRLLGKSEQGVQRLALRCLLRFRESAALQGYADMLERLLGGADTLRNEMARLPLHRGAGVVQEAHREQVVPVVIRLLLGRMLTRKGRGAKDSPRVRRAAVLSYLASLDRAELAYFVQLLVQSFGGAELVTR
ncbi:MAG: hypothetical protein ACK4QW_19575, partial [Alphaproteobacteria bacterium]